MIAIYILFALILTVVIFLLIPLNVSFYIDYYLKMSYKIKIEYLFFEFCFPVAKKRQAIKKRATKHSKGTIKQQKKKENTRIKNVFAKIKDFFNDYSKEEIINLIKAFLYITKDCIIKLFKHVTVKNLKTDACIVGTDSAKTALYYNYIYSISSCLSDFIKTHNKHFKKSDINVQAGFLSLNSTVKAYVSIKIKPWFIISSMLYFALRSIKPLIKFINNK